MGDKIISLQQHRKQVLREKGKQSTLCGNGHHSWEIVTENRFDVKQGKLVTSYRCKRCGKTRSEAR